MVTDTLVKRKTLNKHWVRARITFPLSDLIVGNSNAGLKSYGAPEGKAVCVYNGMNLMRFEKLKDPNLVRNEIFGSIPSDIFIVGMVAMFHPRKDYRTLIESAIQIVTANDTMRFVLIGSGSDLSFIKSKVPSDLSDRIIFLGNLTDVESVINIFDIGVLLTNSKVHGEGISNSIIEYMALGKPVIATNGGGTNEVVIDNYNGFLIEGENIDQLTERIHFLYLNKELSSSLGANGKKLVNQKFDIEFMAKQYISIYSNLLS
jgi:glycosyltransferase involved in cell wall biosynthesis